MAEAFIKMVIDEESWNEAKRRMIELQGMADDLNGKIHISQAKLAISVFGIFFSGVITGACFVAAIL